MKKGAAIRVLLALALVLSLFPGMAYATDYITYYSPVSFSGTSNLALNGSAQLSSGALYLTTSGTSQAGSAFFMSKVKQSDGFSTYFNFTLANRGGGDPGADGIVFIIAANTYSLGAVGEGIGYLGITNSVGIEFDTYPNAHDVSGNHIGINLNGNLTSDTNYSGYSSNVCDLGPNYFNADGPFYVWIDYVSSTKLLSIYISTSSTRPTSASLSKTIDLSTYCGNEYYVGFTAATGGDYEQHKINKWYFKNSYVSGGLSDGGDYATDTTAPTAPTISASGTTVTIAGSSDTGGSGINHYEYQINSTSGTWSAYSSAIDISSYSSVTVYARAVDNVGNISSVSSQTYSVPVLSSVTSSGIGNTSATLSGNVTSGTSLSGLGFKYSSTSSAAADLRASGTDAPVTASVGSFSKSLTGLTPGTTYYYLAYATNSQSTTYSSVYSFTTPISTPAVTVSNVTTESFKLSWDAVNGATGYQVSINSSPAVLLNSGTTSYDVTGINPNINSTYSVIAVGKDTNSSVAAGSKYTLAAQPSITTAGQKQNGSVVLTIDTKGNAAATTYLLEKSTSPAFSSGVTTVVGYNYAGLSSTTVTIPKSLDESVGVLPATTYYFRITAKNGDSVTTTPNATTTGCLTVPEIPGAPALEATETSGGYGQKQIVLDWPDVTGATSYDVYRYNGGTYTYLGTSESSRYTDEALTPNTQYTYAVASRNAGTSGMNDDGRSVYSASSSLYTLAATPDVDTVTALINGNVSVKVEENGNPSITEYCVEASVNADFSAPVASAWTNPDTDHLISISGLNRGTTYYFRVKARNNESTPVVTACGDVIGSVKTIPADVSGTVMVTAASSTTLNVSWSTATGATSYDVYFSTDGSNYTYLKNVTGNSTSDTGLAPNTGRFYKIVARSSSGVSTDGLTSASKVCTYAVTPGLTLTPQADGTIRAVIDTKTNTSDTQYYIEYGTDSALGSSTGSAYSTTTSRSISGLTANTTYYFRVKAQNGENTETSFSAISSALTVPGTPVISSAAPEVNGTTHSVTVSWPTLGAGLAYNIYRDGVLVTTTSGTSYTDSGLKANKVYSYTVAAANGGGIGAESTSVSARTLAEYPDAVTASDKTAASFTIHLTPSANLANAAEYQLVLKKTSDSSILRTLSWSTDLSYTLAGLDKTVSYDVYINTRNSDGLPRGAKNMLTLFCNRAVNGEITNDTADVAIQNDSTTSFAIRMKLWDPDGDSVTATATIGGITRAVTITAPTSEPSSYNTELIWDVDTLVEGTYTADIPVTVTDGSDSTITMNYTHDLTVDKTAPVINITGSNPLYIEVGDTYDSTAALADVDVTGDDGNSMTPDVSAVDTAEAGTYTVTYTSTDNAGNTVTAIRTVIVVEPVTSTTVTLTIPANGVGSTSAVLNGIVTTLGKDQSLTDQGFVWSTAEINADGTSSDPSGLTAVTSISIGTKTNLDSFTSALTGLASESTYYVRPYATYNGTTYYGEEETFTTAASGADTNRIYISPTTVTRMEDATAVTITVSRLGDTTADVTVPIAFSGTATDTNDYTVSDLVSGNLIIAAGNSSATFTVTLVEDTAYESNETIVMTVGPVTDYAAVADNGSAEITIINDDAYVPSSDATISGFIIAGVPAVVSSADTVGTITVTLPYGTDVTSLTPTITFTDSVNATITPIGARDFSVGIVAYTVTAEDGTTKRYEVTVMITPASDNNTLSNIIMKDGSDTVPLSPSFAPDTTEYTAGVPSDTETIDLSAFTVDVAATVTMRCNGDACTDFSSIPLHHGDNTIIVTVTAENGAARTYTFVVTRAAAGVDSNADLFNITLSHGTLVPTFDKGTTDYNVNLPYSTTSTAVSVTLSNSNASYVITANGTTAANGTEVSLNVGANVFVVTVTATDGTIKTYSISVSRAVAPTGDGGNGLSSSSTSSHVPVIINGETVSAGSQTTGTDISGRTTTTVIVDTSLVEEQLNSAGTGATVIIPISGDEQIKSGILTGEMVEKMEKQGATLRVSAGDVTYVLPAEEIKIEDVAKNFGSSISLSDISLTVKVDNLTGTDAKFVANATSSNGYSLVLQPVAFTVSASYNGQTVEVDTFNNYVQRLIEIPDYISPEQITTAVVITETHTYHVPTEVKYIDGKYYAIINSLTNSTYALIWNPVEFADVEGHWAKESINNMGSRTVVNGVGNNNYEPNRNITRAEFAAIVVRALGLDTGMGNSSFNDVSPAAWYYGYIQTAVGYGIVNGYTYETFGPNDPITREQAMTMIARAMKITNLEVSLTDSELSKLIGAFLDGSSASNYAEDSIAACLKTGIVLGRESNMISPKDCITRAEVAVMVERLLQKSDLI
ncbi:MAG: S-layer homology domain-containing protein [Clostridiaceae bacterium]|nr:S-layer homology domain-containing protein [Clostridiaceae bacterium]